MKALARKESDSSMREPSVQDPTSSHDPLLELQRSAGNAAVGRIVGGRPLEPAVRAPMERRFRTDFGDVRIHADSRSSAAADALDAVAFTQRADVVFAEGMYRPETDWGRPLLSHELAHVIQQRRTGVVDSASTLEAEAAGAAADVSSEV